jgi:hypothetical protein
MLVRTLRQEVEQRSSPLGWQRVMLRMLPEFRKEGLFFQNIKDDLVLPSHLVDKVAKEVFALYQIDIFKSQSEQGQ